MFARWLESNGFMEHQREATTDVYSDRRGELRVSTPARGLLTTKFRGDLSAALDRYRAGLAVAERLAKSDPANAGWQIDLGESNELVGGILMRLGMGLPSKSNEALSLALVLHHLRRCSRAFGLCNVEPALKHYRAKGEIIERLAASDPSNAEWQIDLADSHGIIGEADLMSLALQSGLHFVLEPFIEHAV
jgi:hypothetical protein